MPFTPEMIADIANTTLETFIDRKKVHKQNIQAKPMLNAFQTNAAEFTGGNEYVSLAVSSGQGGNNLQGYNTDDQVNYVNTTGVKRARYPWKEHHIGITTTMTELKIDGIEVEESEGGKQTLEMMSDRDMQALANRWDEKMETLDEDYDFSLDRLLHGDGSSDTKALAGIRAFILDVPSAGTTGTISRPGNVWWRNRAATVANGLAGGQGAITPNPANGGSLAAFMQTEIRQLTRYAGSGSKWHWFAGSAWLDAYMLELRANGNYSMTGWRKEASVDAGMVDPTFKGATIEYDPTLDDLGLEKRCYVLDISRNGLQLMYMKGHRLKKHKPVRPYDRYVLYHGLTMTGLMVARRLRTSGVYDIA